MLKRSIFLLTMAFACGDDEPTDDQLNRACESERRWVAAHNSCKTNADCVIVGACSNEWGLRAVSISAADQARQRSRTTACRSSDGPVYVATCSQNHCIEEPTGQYCGMQVLDSGSDAMSSPDAR